MSPLSEWWTEGDSLGPVTVTDGIVRVPIGGQFWPGSEGKRKKPMFPRYKREKT